MPSRDNGSIENQSTYDDEMSETSHLNSYPSRSPPQELERNSSSSFRMGSRKLKVFTPASDNSEASHSSRSFSMNSSDQSVINALKKAHIRNSSHCSSSSQKSIGSSNPKPFRFGSSNNSQQNLDLYIARKRSTTPSSIFFNKVGNSVNIPRPNGHPSVSQATVTEHHGQ